MPSTFAIGSAAFTNDAAGSKLRKASTVSGTTTYTDYIAGIQHSGTTSEPIEYIMTEEGQAAPNGTTSYDYQYFLGDNLGNTRESFGTKTGIAVQYQRDDYYPFGMEANCYVSSPKNYYLYNGKELQEELGVYDYGRRMYDPLIGRWGVPDPKAELLEMSSPYVYSLNSPVNFIDKDGELPIYINGRVTSDSQRGNASYWYYQLLRTIASSGIPNPGGTAHFVDGDRFLYTNPVTYEDHIENGSYISGNDPGERQKAGYEIGLGDFENVLAQLARDPKTGKITEKIQIYTHSRGAAFGAGYTEALLEMIKQHADEFADAENEIDYVYNMGAHQSYATDEPGGVNAYSQHHDLDALSGNGMGGIKAAFSSKETSGGLFGPHSTSSFVKDVGAFTKAFQSSKGDPSKLIDDFVKKMKKDYGINVTVR